MGSLVDADLECHAECWGWLLSVPLPPRPLLDNKKRCFERWGEAVDSQLFAFLSWDNPISVSGSALLGYHLGFRQAEGTSLFMLPILTDPGESQEGPSWVITGCLGRHSTLILTESGFVSRIPFLSQSLAIPSVLFFLSSPLLSPSLPSLSL